MRCFVAIRLLSCLPGIANDFDITDWKGPLIMCLLAHLFAVRVRISLGAITLNHCLASGRDKVRQTVRQIIFASYFVVDYLSFKWQIMEYFMTKDTAISQNNRDYPKIYKTIKYSHRFADLKTFNSLDFWDNCTIENISIKVSLDLGKNTHTYICIFYQIHK